MAIISNVGRKALNIRLLISSVYILLILGSITMIYPFVLMLASSVTSSVDYDDLAILPKFLYDDEMLFRKYLQAKYPQIDELNSRYGTEYWRFKDVILPKVNQKEEPQVKARVEDWYRFIKELKPDKFTVYFGMNEGYHILGEGIRLYQKFLKKKYRGDIEMLNHSYDSQYEGFNEISFPYERLLGRMHQETNRTMMDWYEFKEGLDHRFKQIADVEGEYMKFIKERFKKLDELNKNWETKYQSFTEIRLHMSQPDNPQEGILWEEFVKTRLPYRFMEITGSEELYKRYLGEKYGAIERLNNLLDKNYTSFSTVEFPMEMPSSKIEARILMSFIEESIPIECISIISPENEYREFLKKRYGGIDDLNEKYGTKYTEFEEISPPYREEDWIAFQDNRSFIKYDFIVRNYRTVLNFILFHGRAILNTGILILGMMLIQLTINPLCAYALSRFGLSYTNKILLFLLTTMAFPGEVTMIPNFLLIKELHLLNTYWALILPSAVNGFSIFLMKGFFDSLPDELYEAATLDGASELKMFWTIAFPLSMPIFAVIALGSFATAYGSFMWALIICQRDTMWTIMVYLYQFQLEARPFLMMTALTIASIPTFIVFLFCQRVIMRGIILPAYK